MPDQTAPAIELREISATLGGFEVLGSTSASFPEGLFSIILGAAGSGKSTLIKVAAGLVVPDSGQILYRGMDLARFGRKEELAFRADTGFVFQDAALWADTSILGNVALPLRVHKPWMGDKAIGEAVRSLLLRLGYDESLSARPSELSSGEQKLVSIARAVIHDPSIVFMDDPTSNLDEDALERVCGLFDELKAKKRTVIVAANSSDLAYRYADKLGFLKGGTMVAFGDYEETVGDAQSAVAGSLARLRARGARGRARPDSSGAGAENSQRGDV